MLLFQWQDGKRAIVSPEELAPNQARFPTPPWSQRPGDMLGWLHFADAARYGAGATWRTSGRRNSRSGRLTYFVGCEISWSRCVRDGRPETVGRWRLVERVFMNHP
jgi:hypothetical protein